MKFIVTRPRSCQVTKPAPLLSVMLLLIIMILVTSDAFAAIPLVTDDTGTQGKGKFQIEVQGEYIHDKEEGIIGETNGVTAALTYGIIDPVDIVLVVPYEFWSLEGDESTERENGLSDLAVEVKWRFFERHGLSLALKPGLSLPTGSEDRGLGTGKTTYYLYFITSKEAGPLAVHLNLAYIRNENKGDDRNDLWHASMASTFELVKNLKLVGDIGVESNPDRSSTVPPAYVLGGFVYSPAENFDIGLGVKGGLTKPEADISVRGGITWRF
jgi:hypothetical protein